LDCVISIHGTPRDEEESRVVVGRERGREGQKEGGRERNEGGREEERKGEKGRQWKIKNQNFKILKNYRSKMM
jgi:hypothetical protein